MTTHVSTPIVHPSRGLPRPTPLSYRRRRRLDAPAGTGERGAGPRVFHAPDKRRRRENQFDNGPTSTAAATGRTDGQHLRPSADRAPLVRDTHETDYKEAGAVGIGRAGVISPAATAVQLVRRPIRQHPARGILESWENLSTAIRAASSTTGLHPLPPPPPCFSSPALILQNLY